MSIPHNTDLEENDGEVFTQIGPWAMVPAWVFPYLTPGEFKVYAAIRTFADRSGYGYPKTKTIAERSGLSVSAVRNAVQKMRTLKVLDTREKRRPDGSVAGLDYYLVDVDPGTLSQLEKGKGNPKRGVRTKKSVGGVPHRSDQFPPAETPVLPDGNWSLPQVRGLTHRSDPIEHTTRTHQKTFLNTEKNSLSSLVVNSLDARASAEEEREENFLEEETPNAAAPAAVVSVDSVADLVEPLRGVAARVVRDVGSVGPLASASGNAVGGLIARVHEALEAGYSPDVLVAHLSAAAKVAHSLAYLVASLTPERLSAATGPVFPTNDTGPSVSGPCGNCQAPKHGIEEPGLRVYRLPSDPDTDIPCPECNPQSEYYGTGRRVPSNAVHHRRASSAARELARAALEDALRAQNSAPAPTRTPRQKLDDVETAQDRENRERALAALAAHLEVAA